MTDTETQLKQAKKDRDLALAEANNEVDRLAKLVAEEKRPKPLEHGDYGTFNGKPARKNTARIVIKDSVYDHLGICGHTQDKGMYSILGNIFADLKAIAEPLEEYETGNGMIVRFNNTTLHFSCQDVLLENIHDFILGIRSMEAWKLIADGKLSK